jgi:hypothetical protein
MLKSEQERFDSCQESLGSEQKWLDYDQERRAFEQQWFESKQECLGRVEKGLKRAGVGHIL